MRVSRLDRCVSNQVSSSSLPSGISDSPGVWNCDITCSKAEGTFTWTADWWEKPRDSAAAGLNPDTHIHTFVLLHLWGPSLSYPPPATPTINYNHWQISWCDQLWLAESAVIGSCLQWIMMFRQHLCFTVRLKETKNRRILNEGLQPLFLWF